MWGIDVLCVYVEYCVCIWGIVCICGVLCVYVEYCDYVRYCVYISDVACICECCQRLLVKLHFEDSVVLECTRKMVIN